MRRGDYMWIVCLSIVGSVAASVVVTKILVTHYFKIVDGYVEDMCQKTKDFVDAMKHKLT